MSHKLYVLLALLFALGCGGGGADFKVAPVSGTVTMDAKPLPGVYVNFQPVAGKDNPNPGPGSYAVTDAGGRYTLKLVEGGKPGAVVGMHKVSIALQFAEDLGNPETGTPDGTPPRPKLGSVKQIPEQYNARSTLTFTVPAGGNDKADFPLVSKPSSR
jgi:hypothetical protein